MNHQEWRRGEFLISTDPARVDVAAVHIFLTSAYWAEGIPRETVERSIRASIPFGVYADRRMIGFARVITDSATFAYVGDVFIAAEFRGRGLSVWLMECVVAHPDLRGLRRWMLATRDAHGLYRKAGFRDLASPERWMERHDPDVYRRGELNDCT